MRKTYIIKDAREILAEQIKNNGLIERDVMSENSITNAKGLSAVIPKDNDGYCTVYKMDCTDGLGLMTVYQVYPGIQLIYNDFEATTSAIVYCVCRSRTAACFIRYSFIYAPIGCP